MSSSGRSWVSVRAPVYSIMIVRTVCWLAEGGKGADGGGEGGGGNGGGEGGGDGGTGGGVGGEGSVHENVGVPPESHAVPETDCVGQKAVVCVETESESAV